MTMITSNSPKRDLKHGHKNVNGAQQKQILVPFIEETILDIHFFKNNYSLYPLFILSF